MNIWLLIGIASAFSYVWILIVKACLSVRYAIRHPETDILEGGVTVLQPILGGDPFLAESLRTNLQNVSGDTQFDWLIDENDLPGRQAVESLAQADPGRVRQIVCPPCPDGINPKLFKLNLALPGVTTEYVAVLDDDTMLSPQHLPKAMAVLSDCDLYTGLPRYNLGGNLWSSLVAHFVNNNSILTYLSLLESTGPLTINGMFYVMRTDTLRSYGGFEPILQQLCDDYALARLFQSRGGRIRQGVTSQSIQTSIAGPQQYLRQMHRWFVFANMLVQDQSLKVQCLLAILLGLPSVLLWGSLLCLKGGWSGAVILVLFLGFRHAILRMLHYGVFPEPPRFSWLMSIIAELLQLVHLIHACVWPVITWRSRRIRVGRHGTFTQLRDAKQ